MTADLTLTFLHVGNTYSVVTNFEGEPVLYELPITEGDLQGLLNMINDNFGSIIEKTNAKYYQNSLDIPDKIYKEDLRKVADFGILEYLFKGVTNDDTGTDLIDEIKEFSKMAKRHIAIIGKDFWIPWQLVYDGNLNDEIDKEGFWGFKHVIDFMPLVGKRFHRRSSINSSKLRLSFNVNTGLGNDSINDQELFFKDTMTRDSYFTYETITEESKVIDAFSRAQGLEDSIVYFFCHAQCPQNFDATPDEILLRLNINNEDLTLHKFITRASGMNFVNRPLVFINACESTFMSPVFYNGFIPYFINKGSGGILGTFTKIPAVFASEFALKFFKRFLTGENLNSIMPSLRSKFTEDHNNILGLCYQSFRDCRVEVTHPNNTYADVNPMGSLEP